MNDKEKIMLKDLVLKNRSYRGFDESRKIGREELVELVEYARLCPSSINKQPFKYRLVFEKKEVEALRKIVKWARGLPDMVLPHDGMHPTAFVVVCLDKNTGETVERYQKDVGIVSQTILLAAVEKELGGCMIGNFSPNAVTEALDLGEDMAPVIVLALGKPMEEVILTEVEIGDSIAYYRDEHDVHYVPKRKLSDILL